MRNVSPTFPNFPTMNPLADLQQGQLVALLVVLAAAFLCVCPLPGAMRPARLRPEIG